VREGDSGFQVAVWCDGVPRFLDEDAARSAAALVPDGIEKMGLNGPIPNGFPGPDLPDVAAEDPVA